MGRQLTTDQRIDARIAAATQEMQVRIEAIFRPFWRADTDSVVIPASAMSTVFYELFKEGAVKDTYRVEGGLAFPARSPSVGRVYRIPTLAGSADVTRKEAKAEAKRLRRAAKAIDRALRS